MFNVSIKELPQKNPTFVRRLFRDVLKNVKQQMEVSPNDYLRVNIEHPSLDSHEEIKKKVSLTVYTHIKQFYFSQDDAHTHIIVPAIE